MRGPWCRGIRVDPPGMGLSAVHARRRLFVLRHAELVVRGRGEVERGEASGRIVHFRVEAISLLLTTSGRVVAQERGEVSGEDWLSHLSG